VICSTLGLSIREEYLRWPWNKAYIPIRWDTASWCGRNSCEKRYSLFSLAVSAYKRL